MDISTHMPPEMARPKAVLIWGSVGLTALSLGDIRQSLGTALIVKARKGDATCI